MKLFTGEYSQYIGRPYMATSITNAQVPRVTLQAIRLTGAASRYRPSGPLLGINRGCVGACAAACAARCITDCIKGGKADCDGCMDSCMDDCAVNC